MPDIELFINEKIYSGWTFVSIRKSLEQIAGVFELGFTERFPGNVSKWRIRLGDACEVRLAGETVISGYIDDIDPSHDAEAHSIIVRGRDQTADLVDCPYVETPNEWENQTLDKIVDVICFPFDIPLVLNTDVGEPFEHERTKEGDTAFDFISDLCKQRSILPVCFGDGNLTLTRTGNEQALSALILGKNIKSGMLKQSSKDRYREYVVKAQGTGFDEKKLADYVEPFGESIDVNITRYRPLVIISETQGTNKSLQERARWEKTTRIGRSRKYMCTVQGWQQFPHPVLWQLNTLVRISDDIVGLNDTWLISGLNFSLTEDGGTITEITAMPPVAFQQIAKDSETDDAATKWESLLKND
jgi:prophage tail gpP-like protein